ncbi:MULTISPECIES: BhlA/UviB family holin-like peptide [Bacillaceae]|uniref:Holin n=1 Tax=Domibacillus aminovorans TaxID=29332 RepID=A0A177KIH9_9BACI|nr:MULTISPECIES: BhlA/UviB family holin-like peptide [Bacillaceae]OAH52924.1 holin [Domibacillus aminovorans]
MDLTQLPPEMWVQGIFCILFVWLLKKVMDESVIRENKLYTQIERQNETQDKIVGSLERLEKDVYDIKNKGE